MIIIRKTIYNFYSFIDNIRYLFFGIRHKLDKPLFTYPKEVRLFLAKYGQNGKHYGFKTENKEEQLSFLFSYCDYLKFTHPNREFNVNGDFIETENTDNSVKIFFQKNRPVYKCLGKDGSRGEGSISLILEHGIL